MASAAVNTGAWRDRTNLYGVFLSKSTSCTVLMRFVAV